MLGGMNGQSLIQRLAENGALDSHGRWIIGSTHRYGAAEWSEHGDDAASHVEFTQAIAGVDLFPWLPAPLFETEDFIARFDKANNYLRMQRDAGLSYSEIYQGNELAEAIAVAVGDVTSVDLAVRLKDKIVSAVERKVRFERQHAKRAAVLQKLGVAREDLLTFPYEVPGEDNAAWQSFLQRNLLPDIIVMAESGTIARPFPHAAAAVKDWVEGLNRDR